MALKWLNDIPWASLEPITPAKRVRTKKPYIEERNETIAWHIGEILTLGFREKTTGGLIVTSRRNGIHYCIPEEDFWKRFEIVLEPEKNPEEVVNLFRYRINKTKRKRT